MSTDDDGEPDYTDDAIAKRLARLRDRPVDTAGLRLRMHEHIAAHRPKAPNRRWITPRRVFAASLFLLGSVVALLLTTRSSGVLASPMELSLIHRGNISGEEGAVIVNSMASVQRILTDRWTQCPRLPDCQFGQVKSCHVHQHAGKRLACVEMTVDGQTLTLAVASAADMRLPEAPTVSRNGDDYRIQSSGGVNIVVTRRRNLWICLMGELPVDLLVDVAASLRV